MDVERVLNEIGLGVESIIEGEYVVYCPYHHNVRTPSGEVEMSTGLFYCFSCNQTASLEELAMEVTNCSIYEAMRLVRSDRSNIDVRAEMDKFLATSGPKFEPFDEVIVDKLHYSCITSQEAMNYWYSRGLNDHSVYEFQLGYSAAQNMAITPLHTVKGELLGFQGRTISGSKRFKNSTGLKKSQTLFNIHRVKTARDIVIVESPIDAMLLSQEGIAAIASMGASMSKTQLELLTSYFNYAIVIPDADEAGEGMVAKLRATYNGQLTVIKLPPNVKDVGELTKEQLEYLANKVNDPLLGLTM